MPASTFMLGREARTNAILESAAAFGVWQGTVATSSFKVRSGAVTINEDRKDRVDARQSRSLIETILGDRSAEYRLATYMLPKGGAVPLDIDALLTAGFGVETIGGASVTYSLSASQALPSSFSLAHELSSVLMLGLRGAVVEEFTITHPGNDVPTFEIQGPAVAHVQIGSANHDGASAGLASTAITLATPIENYVFDAGANSKIQVGTDTNGGAGYVISSINRATGVLTIAPGLGTDQNANPLIVPHTNWADGSTGGLAIPAISGQIDLGADTDILISSFKVSVKNNWKEKRAAFRNVAVGYIPNFREVSGELGVFGRRDDLKRWAWAQQHDVANVNPLALTVIFGSLVSGQPQIAVVMPKVEFNFGQVEIGDGGEEASITLPFKARATTNTAEDEISLVTRNAA